jgi:hypothetical protein
MTIHFYYPTLELFGFSFTQPFTHSKFCLPNPFLFVARLVPYKQATVFINTNFFAERHMQLDNVNKKQTLIDLDALCVQAVLASNEVNLLRCLT